MTENRTPDASDTLRLDAEAIKVLAHPLRSRLLSTLRREGSATATSLAERLETNSGATSYHLRKLAAVGLVEETGQGHGRERWWRPTTTQHAWTYETVEHDPDGRAAAAWLRQNHLRTFYERSERWLGRHDQWPLEWRRVAGPSDYLLELSPGRLEELMHELQDVVERYRNGADAVAPDVPLAGDTADSPVAQVAIYLFALPELEGPR